MSREQWKQRVRERRQAQRTEEDRLFTIDAAAIRDASNPHAIIRTTPRCDGPMLEEVWDEQWGSTTRIPGPLRHGRGRGTPLQPRLRSYRKQSTDVYILAKANLPKALKPRTKQLLIASAIVVPNATIRALLDKLLTYTYEVVRPNQFCEDTAAAVALWGHTHEEGAHAAFVLLLEVIQLHVGQLRLL